MLQNVPREKEDENGLQTADVFLYDTIPSGALSDDAAENTAVFF